MAGLSRRLRGRLEPHRPHPPARPIPPAAQGRTALRPDRATPAKRNHRNSPSPKGRMPCLVDHGADRAGYRSVGLRRSLSLTGRCPCRLSQFGDRAAMDQRFLWMDLGLMWITDRAVDNLPDHPQKSCGIWGFLCGSPGLCVDWHRIATYGRWISGYVWWITTGLTNTVSRPIPELLHRQNPVTVDNAAENERVIPISPAP